MTDLLQHFSELQLTWFIGLFLGIILINMALKGFFNVKLVEKTGMKKGFFTSLSSLFNWVTFYCLILLFLLYFSKSSWLLYPLYSNGGVDVSLFLIIVAIMIVSLADRLLKLMMRYVLTPVYEYYRIDRGLGYTFNQIIYYTLMIVAIAISFTSVGIDLSALGTFFSVLGIGIGFGMRNVAGNFVSGIIILFERPVEVGEVIQIDQKIGRVEKIRLRSTVVRTAKEGVLIVPNQYFIEQIIKNRTGAEMMAQVAVSVEYGTDTTQVEDILREAAKKVTESTDGILSAPAPDIRFVDLRNRSMDFLIEIPVTSFEIKEQVESRLRHSIVQLFIENKIALASPVIEP
ncbi:mechanosensitive ion channel family protein [Domibacillus robiginosus]|uniref:mechanosensitive ion channel family protein n=1 Tax=Domibacillus robiginosus TaxID=1071054 RepID=UPI00067D7BF5|nr:mechanosensitive ion channel domain-containing protein [Domibacillus robiginosus]